MSTIEIDDVQESEDVQQLCTFHVGDMFLGVDVRVVQEVIRYQEMTPVPLARNGIEGLINLRGQIVTALDPRISLDLPPSDSRRTSDERRDPDRRQHREPLGG